MERLLRREVGEEVQPQRPLPPVGLEDDGD